MVTADPKTPASAAKANDAYRTISEVSEELDVPTHVLRFWESKFPQVKPQRMRGGRRYYRPVDVETLKKIKTLLYSQGYTIEGAKKCVKDKEHEVHLAIAMEEAAPPIPPALPVALPPAPERVASIRNELPGLIAELRELKKMLAAFSQKSTQ